MGYEVAAVLGSGLLALIFAYLSSKVADAHRVLQTLFVFVAVLLALNTAGMVNNLDYSWLQSPSLIYANGQYAALYYNSTGELVFSNSTTNGTIWNHTVLQEADPQTGGDVGLLLGGQVFLLSWVFYIVMAYYVVFYIYDVLVWISKKSRKRPV